MRPTTGDAERAAEARIYTRMRDECFSIFSEHGERPAARLALHYFVPCCAMNYTYNRAAFRSVCDTPGVHPLADAYCTCVLLELSLKQYLTSTGPLVDHGHDLPTLLQRVGLKHTRYTFACNALQRQIADALRSLRSQAKDGSPCSIPSRSYPYLRYLRHDSDWPAPSSSDAEISALNGLLKRALDLLRKQIGVNV